VSAAACVLRLVASHRRFAAARWRLAASHRRFAAARWRLAASHRRFAAARWRSTSGPALALLLASAACASPRAPAEAERSQSAQAEKVPATAVTDKAPPAAAAPAEAASAQTAQPALFGAPLDPSTPELSLAALLAEPATHAGKTVRARGTIQRVCQRMGCWMELQGEGAPSAVRVPMADHAFVLPQSAVGRRAEIQGKVSVNPLSDAHKRHLQEEGAQATDVNVSIAATGVMVK
jgi:hypothetical protein